MRPWNRSLMATDPSTESTDEEPEASADEQRRLMSDNGWSPSSTIRSPCPAAACCAPCAMPETSSPNCRSAMFQRPFPRQMFPHILVISCACPPGRLLRYVKAEPWGLSLKIEEEVRSSNVPHWSLGADHFDSKLVGLPRCRIVPD